MNSKQFKHNLVPESSGDAVPIISHDDIKALTKFFDGFCSVKFYKEISPDTDFFVLIHELSQEFASLLNETMDGIDVDFVIDYYKSDIIINKSTKFYGGVAGYGLGIRHGDGVVMSAIVIANINVIKFSPNEVEFRISAVATRESPKALKEDPNVWQDWINSFMQEIDKVKKKEV